MKISLAAVLCILFAFNVYAGGRGKGVDCTKNDECASNHCDYYMCK